MRPITRAAIAAFVGLHLFAATARAAAAPDYLTGCSAPVHPVTCFVVEGFAHESTQNRTMWELINDAQTPATVSYYLYNPTTGTSVYEQPAAAVVQPGGHLEYPDIHDVQRTDWTPDSLIGVFTSDITMTLQIIGPTVQCPRAAAGNITCTEVHAVAGAEFYSFYNQMENPNAVWIHTLYIGGVAQAPFSDVMSGPETKQYATGMGQEQGVQIAAAPLAWQARTTRYTGGPLPPRYQPPLNNKLYLPIATC